MGHSNDIWNVLGVMEKNTGKQIWQWRLRVRTQGLFLCWIADIRCVCFCILHLYIYIYSIYVVHLPTLVCIKRKQSDFSVPGPWHGVNSVLQQVRAKFCVDYLLIRPVKIHKVLRQNAMQLYAVMQWPEKIRKVHVSSWGVIPVASFRYQTQWLLWLNLVLQHSMTSLWNGFLLTIWQENWIATLNILNLETVNSTAARRQTAKQGSIAVGCRLCAARYCNVQAGLQSVFKMSTQSLKYGLFWT